MERTMRDLNEGQPLPKTPGGAASITPKDEDPAIHQYVERILAVTSTSAGGSSRDLSGPDRAN